MSLLELGGETNPSTPNKDTGGPDAIRVGAAGEHEGNPPAGLQTHEDLEKELKDLQRAQSLLSTEKQRSGNDHRRGQCSRDSGELVHSF